MTEPSVLVYARGFGLTQDHRENDICRHLEDLQPSQPSDLLLKTYEDILRITHQFISAAERLSSAESNDDTQRSRIAAEYLRRATDHNRPDINEIYKMLLPDHQKIRKCKVELPLLTIGGGDVKKDVRKIRGGVNLDQALEDLSEDYEQSTKTAESDNDTSRKGRARVLGMIREKGMQYRRPEPLMTSSKVIRYLKETLSTSIDLEGRLAIIDDMLPGPRHSYSPLMVLLEADFPIEIENEFDPEMESQCAIKADEMNVLVCRDEIHQHGDQDMLSCIDSMFSDEVILSGQPGIPTVESTQKDSIIPELNAKADHAYRSPTPESITITCGKKRKLTHTPNTSPCLSLCESIQDVSPTTKSADVSEWKITVPRLEGWITKLPDIDQRHLKVEVSGADRIDSLNTKSLSSTCRPPFTTPSLREIFKPQVSHNTVMLERVYGKQKRVMASDEMLWKEPGLRLLDRVSEDIENLSAAGFDFEEIETEGALAGNAQSSETGTDTFVACPPSLRIERGSGYSRLEDEVVIKDDNPSLSVDRVSTSILLATGKLTVSQKGYNASRKPTVPTRPIITDQLPRSTMSSNNDSKCSGTTGSLANFMALRGKQFKSFAPKGPVRDLEINTDPILSSQFSESNTSNAMEVDRVEEFQSLRGNDAWHHPIPEIVSCEQYSVIVLNNSLLQHKPLLIQFLESQMSSNFHVIYRDLDSDMIKGPDMIINLTTCLLIVSLQLLSQRPLPGQKSRTGLSPAHDQIYTAYSSYDHIFVLVHFVLATQQEAEIRMQAAGSEFMAFCTSLTSNSIGRGHPITPVWVPCIEASKTSDIVNAWIWRVIRQYAFKPGDRTAGGVHSALIDDVTLWESLLVKAGLNPMAAQVMIGLLKNSSVAGTGTDGAWGLRRLMSMSAQERHHVFDGIVGRRAVQRLSGAVSNRIGS